MVIIIPIIIIIFFFIPLFRKKMLTYLHARIYFYAYATVVYNKLHHSTF